MTVLEMGEPYQITTYRTEQDYIDNRRPGQIRFSKSLDEDPRAQDGWTSARYR